MTISSGSANTSTNGVAPIIPDYAGANVRGIIPALLGPAPWSTGLPAWMPAPVASAKRAVLLVLDGLGWDQLQAHRRSDADARVDGRWADPHRRADDDGDGAHARSPPGSPPASTASSATGWCSVATSSTCCAGRSASRPVGGRIRQRDVQPFDPFLGRPVPVVSPAELQNSAFSEAHLRGSQADGLACCVVDLGRGRSPARGRANGSCTATTAGSTRSPTSVGSVRTTTPSSRFADQIVADMSPCCPPARPCWSPPITARSTSAQRDRAIRRPARTVSLPVGRRAVPVAARVRGSDRLDRGRRRRDEFGHVGFVVTKDQMLDEDWFGPSVTPAIRVAARRRRAGRVRAGELPRPRRLRPVRTRLPPRLADVGRGLRAAARHARLSRRRTDPTRPAGACRRDAGCGRTLTMSEPTETDVTDPTPANELVHPDEITSRRRSGGRVDGDGPSQRRTRRRRSHVSR